LNKYFDGFLYRALEFAYPEQKWFPWLLSQSIPKEFWTKQEYQRKYMDWLGRKLNYYHHEAWYQVAMNDFVNNKGGKEILEIFENSIAKSLAAAYPNYEWLNWKFNYMPRSWWDDEKNQRIFMDWMGRQLNFKKKDDWYKLSKTSVVHYGGEILLKKYENSTSKLLMGVFPHFDWIHWRFSGLPKGYWDEKSNQKEYIDWLGRKLGFQKTEDWYRVKRRDFMDNGGSILLSRFNNSPINVIHACVFPKWPSD